MGQTFACKYAYLTRETGKNKVVLCDRAGTPDFKQYKSIVSCMCAYQPPCPEKQLCALAEGWEKCWRLEQERKSAAAAEPKRTTKRKKKSE